MATENKQTKTLPASPLAKGRRISSLSVLTNPSPPFYMFPYKGYFVFYKMLP